jgi:hypothetical protein
VIIDGKVVKCSRVILKQETKQTQLADAKPTMGFGVPNSVHSIKKISQAKSQKSTKSKKKPKISLCAQNDDTGSQDDLTKESSHSNSCERTEQTSTFSQFNNQAEINTHIEQTTEYEFARYLKESVDHSLFHKQYVHPELISQEGDLSALNYGWRQQDQFGGIGFIPGNLFDHRLVQQGQDWFQSTQQESPNWMYRTDIHHKSQTAQIGSKKSSYYRMF